MGFDPTERVPLGRTGLEITPLGFGCASIGGLFRPVRDEDAAATVERAWDLGIRYFDVAPLYGYGAAERRLGSVLRTKRRDEFVLSTKVGRLVRRAAELPHGADVDRQELDGARDAYYADIGDRRMVFDYSGDGVRRSIEESLERLGLDRIDVALIHDPDDHWQPAMDQAYPALHRLREEGVVRAIGAGMNQSEMLRRFARETDMDVFLLAGRYTLLDQGAADELLPACLEKGIAIVAGGVMNSGVLANPAAGATYNYQPAPPAIVDRARRITAIAERHGVPVKAAAVQFPLAHPAVAGLLAGVRTIAHLEEYPELMRLDIPNALWEEMRAEGLLR